jgi:hypothetical protein
LSVKLLYDLRENLWWIGIEFIGLRRKEVKEDEKEFEQEGNET